MDTPQPEQEPRTGPEPVVLAQPIRVVRVSNLAPLFAWAVVLALFFYFFDTARLVILGVLAAGCLTAALRPIASRIPGPRPVRAFLTGMLPFVILAGLVGAATYVMANRMQADIQQWALMRENVNALLARWTAWMGLAEPLDVQTLLGELRDFLTAGRGQELVETTAAAMAGLLIAFAFILFGTIYFLLEPPGRLLSPIQRMLPPLRRKQVGNAMRRLEPRLRWWTIGTLCSMTIVGTATYIGFRFIGLELALPLALLAAVAEIVPNIGPFTAFMIAMLFAITQDKVVGVLILWLIIQGLEGNLITPLVMRKAVKIPPFVTLVSVIFWGKLFGLPGVLLAIPLNLLVWSFVEQFLLHRYDLEKRAAVFSTSSMDDAMK